MTEQKVTQAEKEKAIATLRAYETQAKHHIRDCVEYDCPSEQFEPGKPNGNCDGDGHYLCKECIHYNINTIYK